MALPIALPKFEDDIMSGFFVQSPVRYVTFDEVKRTLDKVERSSEEIELNQFVGVMNQLTKWTDKHQNLGFMSSRTKFFELLYINDYMFTFSRYRNFIARNYHLKSSNIWMNLSTMESQHLFQNEYGKLKLLNELQMSNTTGNKLLSLHNNEPCVDIEFTQRLAKEGKTTSQVKDNSTSSENPNKQKYKEFMPKSHTKLQLKRKKIAQLFSFAVIMIIIILGPYFEMWIEPSLRKVQHGQVCASLIRLLGFMVFVWGVTTMILVGVPFVRMQSLVLIFWAISMHLKS